MGTTLLEQYIKLIVEAEMSGQAFDLNSIRGLTNPKQLMSILARAFGPPIGGGVARIAYAYSNDKVLKVAYAGSDAATHNEKEVKNAECIGEHYAIKVYDHDPNFMWILEERVKKTTQEDLENKFHELAGVPLNIEQIKDLFAGNPDMGNIHKHLYGQNKWYKGLVDKLKGCKAGAEDFHYNNWGIRPSTGELVLLDLGF